MKKVKITKYNLYFKCFFNKSIKNMILNRHDNIKQLYNYINIYNIDYIIFDIKYNIVIEECTNKLKTKYIYNNKQILNYINNKYLKYDFIFVVDDDVSETPINIIDYTKTRKYKFLYLKSKLNKIKYE